MQGLDSRFDLRYSVLSSLNITERTNGGLDVEQRIEKISNPGAYLSSKRFSARNYHLDRRTSPHSVSRLFHWLPLQCVGPTIS